MDVDQDGMGRAAERVALSSRSRRGTGRRPGAMNSRPRTCMTTRRRPRGGAELGDAAARRAGAG